MGHINADNHPGLYRYSQEVRQYPELTDVYGKIKSFSEFGLDFFWNRC